jgi:hypothetical protein
MALHTCMSIGSRSSRSDTDGIPASAACPRTSSHTLFPAGGPDACFPPRPDSCARVGFGRLR